MRFTIGPVVLILLGAFLLLNNLNLLPIGKLKELASTWWPLALILVGFFQLRKR